MGKEDFSKGMILLSKAFNKDFGEDQINVWYSFFKDVELETFKKAIKIIVEQKKYFPSIAELKEEINKLTIEDYDVDVKNEWGLVLEAIRKTGYYKQDEFEDMLKPKTLKVCQRMGIEHLLTMDMEEKPSMQKLFINLYEGMTNYEKNEKIYEENIKRLQEQTKDFLLNSQEF